MTAGDRVDLGPAPPPPFPAPLRRIHEDEELLVVDKPAGLLTIATERERERTVYALLTAYVAEPASRGRRGLRPRVYIVHRLDRETSGVIVFAKSVAAKTALQAQFEARTAERLYVAVVEGRVQPDRGTLTDRLVEDAALLVRPTRRSDRGRTAITRYEVRERRGDMTVLTLTLETGRRGQIRAQLAALGHPIVGDRTYGSRRDPVGRVCLHAWRLALTHPRGGRVRFESPIPAVFSRLSPAGFRRGDE